MCFRVLSVAFFFLPALLYPVSAKTLDDWYSGPKAKDYAEIRGDLETLCVDLKKNDVPAELLIERLREGSAKNIPPDRLLDAVSRDCGRFAFLSLFAAELFSSGLPDHARLSFLRDGAIILRSGINEDIFVASLASVTESGLARRVAAALAVGAVNTRFTLKGETYSRLVIALDRSPDIEKRFSRLSSIFVRGRAINMGVEEIAELAIRILSGGGSLFSLETEIDGSAR